MSVSKLTIYVICTINFNTFIRICNVAVKVNYICTIYTLSGYRVVNELVAVISNEILGQTIPVLPLHLANICLRLS